jgi:hypothetical protein
MPILPILPMPILPILPIPILPIQTCQPSDKLYTPAGTNV